MPPHCQLVMGPAGVGKSTYCQAMQEHAANERHHVHVANLDPAAEHFGYNVAFDIRDLISLEDVMEEMELGPNGGLLYCMEYLLENLEWLKDQFENYADDEYLIIDCPGQVELYSHVPVMRTLVELLQSWGLKICGCYLIDATYAADPTKFISGSLLSLSAMIQLELPHLNVLTKCDLVDEDELNRVLDFESASMLLDSTFHARGKASDKIMKSSRADDMNHDEDDVYDENDDYDINKVKNQKNIKNTEGEEENERETGGRLSKLTFAITSLLDDFTMVSFVPLNLKDEASVNLVLHAAENLTQYGEDREPNEKDYNDE
eukprot:CAMPEP_0114353760 /NCGR_PEP_ID=MMETSP0101-20121206/18914_1 /TAXON_ID=38822 ORGANISM="Pteridomonas danica, Strain PT" /NCGR_SAMPLE_ID=MMETSP0101 /ASSEMBLY_ACC=CAM_ASM_000211 /LENGTH=318 /DNA_ID=CAMNT_0001494775 /DNA_START=50 /DNA_END=1006 /DNA_ORIENTATION=-